MVNKANILYLCGGGLVAKLCPTLGTSWTVGYQAPRCMEFPRHDH